MDVLSQEERFEKENKRKKEPREEFVDFYGNLLQGLGFQFVFD